MPVAIGPKRSKPWIGPVISDGVCGVAIGGCFGCRSAVERYPAKSLDGWVPPAIGR